MEIIGVSHARKEISEVVAGYIDCKHPNLESILIELSPEYKQFEGNGDDFFRPMADYFESKGVRVIPGDRKRWDVMGLSGEEAVDMYHNNPLKFVALETVSIYLGLLNGKLFKDRDEDMDALCKQEKPDVVVVGGSHAKYIKEHNPESMFVYFTEKEQIIGKIVNAGTYRASDMRVYVGIDSPKIRRQQIRNSITSLAGGGVVAAAVSLDLPALVAYPAAWVGLHACLSNFGNIIEYVKTIRREQKNRTKI